MDDLADAPGLVPGLTDGVALVIDLLLGAARKRAFSVLCIGAHCDDIEIGCGATLLTLQADRTRLRVDWLVLSGSADRQRESAAAMRRLVRPAHRGDLVFGDFPDGRFPAAYSGIKDFLESAAASRRPDLIFTHEREDRHQDHRVAGEVTWNSFRDHLILEYEIPKWDGGLGQPNVYVPVTSRHAAAKASALAKSHRTQGHKDWFTADTFMATLRLRGVECRSPSGYAEAFHGRKIRLAGL